MNLNTLNQNNMKEKGWQNMKVLLDKELPEKKKRRTIFWLFLGFIFSALAAYGVWSTEHNIKIKTDVIEPSQIQFVEKALNNKIEKFNKNGVVVEKQKAESISLKQLDNKSIAIASRQKKLNLSDSGQDIINIEAPFSTLNHNANSISSGETPSSGKEENISSNISQNNINQKGTTLYNVKEEIEALPILPSFIISEENTNIMHADIIKVKQSKQSGFDLFLTGGLGSYSFKNAELNYFGIRTNLKLNQKFSLGSALLYHTLSAKPNETINEATGVTTGNAEAINTYDGIVLEEDAKNLDEFNPVNTPGQVQKTSINKLTYLKLPVLLEYKINKVLDVFAGPQVNYLTTISSAPSNANANGDFYNLTYNNKSIKRIYPSYTAGMRCMPWNRVTLDLAVNYDKKIVLATSGSRFSALAGVSIRLF